MKKILKKFTVLLIISALIVIPFETGLASEDELENRDPSFGAMFFDFLVLRPGGAIATAVGAGCFVVTLPFSLLGRNAGTAAEKMVGGPVKFTFFRPLGSF